MWKSILNALKFYGKHWIVLIILIVISTILYFAGHMYMFIAKISWIIPYVGPYITIGMILLIILFIVLTTPAFLYGFYRIYKRLRNIGDVNVFETLTHVILMGVPGILQYQMIYA